MYWVRHVSFVIGRMKFKQINWTIFYLFSKILGWRTVSHQHQSLFKSAKTNRRPTKWRLNDWRRTRDWTHLGDGPITGNQSAILLEGTFINVYMVIKTTFYLIGSVDCCGVMAFYFPVQSDELLLCYSVFSTFLL